MKRWIQLVFRWGKSHLGPASLTLAVVVGIGLLLALPVQNQVLSGGLIAVLTLAVNQGFELVRRRSEERRWHAGQFLKDKIDSLRKLFAALDDWYRTLIYYDGNPPQTREELRTRILVKEDAFLEALAYAQIYLSGDDDETVRNAMASCRAFQRNYVRALPDSEFPHGRGIREQPWPPDQPSTSWAEFMRSRDAAVNVLSRLLNPKSLRLLEESLEEE
jgi:hypothetical protein